MSDCDPADPRGACDMLLQTQVVAMQAEPLERGGATKVTVQIGAYNHWPDAGPEMRISQERHVL